MDMMTLTTETVNVLELGENSPFDPFRVVLDKSTRTVYFLGDEGEIRTQPVTVPEIGLMEKFGQYAQSMADRANGDEWSESDILGMMDEADKLGDRDKVTLLWAIVLYLNGTGFYHENDHNRSNILKMWENYRNGLCTLDEAVTDILAHI